mgnify:CR=1 FL=1
MSFQRIRTFLRAALLPERELAVDGRTLQA